ncbi:MAG: hypothetical protein ACW99U_12935 [Candidatus Thorarchaeota archaeon]
MINLKDIQDELTQLEEKQKTLRALVSLYGGTKARTKAKKKVSGGNVMDNNSTAEKARSILMQSKRAMTANDIAVEMGEDNKTHRARISAALSYQAKRGTVRRKKVSGKGWVYSKK